MFISYDNTKMADQMDRVKKVHASKEYDTSTSVLLRLVKSTANIVSSTQVFICIQDSNYDQQQRYHHRKDVQGAAFLSTSILPISHDRN